MFLKIVSFHEDTQSESFLIFFVSGQLKRYCDCPLASSSPPLCALSLRELSDSLSVSSSFRLSEKKVLMTCCELFSSSILDFSSLSCTYSFSIFLLAVLSFFTPFVARFFLLFSSFNFLFSSFKVWISFSTISILKFIDLHVALHFRPRLCFHVLFCVVPQVFEAQWTQGNPMSV